MPPWMKVLADTRFAAAVLLVGIAAALSLLWAVGSEPSVAEALSAAGAVDGAPSQTISAAVRSVKATTEAVSGMLVRRFGVVALAAGSLTTALFVVAVFVFTPALLSVQAAAAAGRRGVVWVLAGLALLYGATLAGSMLTLYAAGETRHADLLARGCPLLLTSLAADPRADTVRAHQEIGCAKHEIIRAIEVMAARQNRRFDEVADEIARR